MFPNSGAVGFAWASFRVSHSVCGLPRSYMPAGDWTEYAINNLDKDAAREKLIQNPRHIKLAQACQWLERNAAHVSKIRKQFGLEGLGAEEEIAAADVAVKDAKQVAVVCLILRLVLGCASSSPLDTADARGQAVAQLKGQIAHLPVEDASNAMLEKYIAEGTAAHWRSFAPIDKPGAAIRP